MARLRIGHRQCAELEPGRFKNSAAQRNVRLPFPVFAGIERSKAKLERYINGERDKAFVEGRNPSTVTLTIEDAEELLARLHAVVDTKNHG